MSIVAVHGPNTFGSKAVAGGEGPLMATVDPTNGLKWDFKLDSPTTRLAADFSWTFPTDGTPTPQAVVDPAIVTYATGGAKTAQLVVTGAGTGASPYPPAGTYTLTVNAVVGTGGTGASLLGAKGEDDVVYDEEAYGEFILAEHELDEIQSFLSHYPLSEDDWDALIDEESAEANRSEVLDWINSARS